MEKIETLSTQVEDLKGEMERLKMEKEKEAEQLRRAKEEIEKSLEQEIRDKLVTVEMLKRGLVLTFVSEVLFDSGKAIIKSEAYDVLGRVSRVLNKTVANRNVSIEGHTDNEPIKYSGWKSNWELSTARATGVLHHLIDKEEVSPERLSAAGYGEYSPVAANDTKEGRQKNRRVEIIILPEVISKVKGEMLEGKENLK
ncbi:MAG: OmpA family protein [Candidatus Omnitrophica bacterium]|nr:OmpA family protein [Candidatus Omnitrophota bacterium]